MECHKGCFRDSGVVLKSGFQYASFAFPELIALKGLRKVTKFEAHIYCTGKPNVFYISFLHGRFIAIPIKDYKHTYRSR